MTQDGSKGFQRTLTSAAPYSTDPLPFLDAAAAVVGVLVQAAEGPVASSIEIHCDLEFLKKWIIDQNLTNFVLISGAFD